MNALHRLPVLETAEVKMLLNGPESFTPDGSFMLGESAETRGFFLGCGMNSVGVATGGGAGMALAHCIIHGHTPTDLQEPIIYDEHKNILVTGGVRSGKSEICADRLTGQYWLGKLYWLLGLDYEMCRPEFGYMVRNASRRFFHLYTLFPTT